MEYIEHNLQSEIDYKILAKSLGINVCTMKKLFSIITGISLSEYIRKRRLSNAGIDLYQQKFKIIDIAVKYQYENATSFSRAFTKFHGIKPSLVNKNTSLKSFSRIVFNEDINLPTEFDYEIITLEKIDLYGISVITNNERIEYDAPLLFMETTNKYIKDYGPIKYGMITYDTDRDQCQKYYCLYDKRINKLEHILIPKSKWLRFRINSQNAKDIQDISSKFYHNFLPSCKYNLKDLPELEYYHDNITDFLVAIY